MAWVRGPWAWSLGFHLVLGALLVGWWASRPVDEPPVLRMRLVSAPGAPQAAVTGGGRWWKPTPTAPTVEEPATPGWRDPAVGAANALAEPAPFRLEELLTGLVPPPESGAEPAAEPAARAVGWSSGGEGYALPPLPPPQLSPPQGARWSLVLKVSGSGGFASVEGLDSGHPELDRWLEGYLRSVVFPPSLDGQDYQLRWNLRLDSGRPE